MVRLPCPGHRSGVKMRLLLPGILLAVSLHGGRTIDSYVCKNWTQEDGLPMNSILAAAQTSDGYLWLGTETGLVRFDGVRFDTFNRDNEPELAIDFVVSLLADRRGTLWVGTRGGGLFRYREGRFSRLSHDPALNEAWAIVEAADGAVWIGCRGGLYRHADDEIRPIPLPGSGFAHYVRSLAEDHDGRIWVGRRNGGVCVLTRQGERWEAEEKGFADTHIGTLFVDRDGTVWAGTPTGAIIRFRGDQVTRYSSAHGLSGNAVNCFFQDRSGTLWIGTAGGGITLFDVHSGLFTPFDPRNEMNSQIIYTLFRDRENNIWAGTNGNGVVKLREALIKTFTSRQGLSSDVVFSVFQDSGGTVWAGTMSCGINTLRGDRFHALDGLCGLSVNSVTSIGESPTGCLWFGTFRGLDCLENGRFRTYDRESGLTDNLVRALYTDAGGTLWVGLANGDVFSRANGRFSLAGNVEYRVNTIYRDRRGDLWVGSFGSGLNRFRDGRRQVYDRRAGMPGNCVLCLHEERDGSMWIGTYRDGLVRFRDGRFRSIARKDGLADDTIYCILEDSRRDLWMSSNRGVMRIGRHDLDEFLAGRRRTLTPAVFGKDHGMRSMECNGGLQPSGMRSADGRLWFPTTRGVAVIDPRHVHAGALPPPVLIQRLALDGAPLHPRDGIVVPPGRGDLEIDFTAPSFLSPEKIQFRYRLDGRDADWVDAGTRRQASYGDLPPGTYTFRVIAANGDGVWNLAGASLRFRLQPHLHQTTAFRLGVPLLLVGLLFGARSIRQRVHDIRRRRRKLGRTGLQPEEVERCVQKLLFLMEEEKVYRDPNLTLKSLSARLLISPRFLSEIINEKLHRNFIELVNHYRIREARQILAAPDKQQSILEVSYQIGFNSKSAFNRAFKFFSGMTPSEFIRSGQQRKSRPAS